MPRSQQLAPDCSFPILPASFIKRQYSLGTPRFVGWVVGNFKCGATQVARIILTLFTLIKLAKSKVCSFRQKAYRANLS